MMGRAGIDEISLITLLERDDADAAEGRGNVVYFELFGGRWWVAGLAAAASRGGMIIRDLHQTQRSERCGHHTGTHGYSLGAAGAVAASALWSLVMGAIVVLSRDTALAARAKSVRSTGRRRGHQTGMARGGGRSVDARGCRDQCGCRMRRRGGRGLGFLEISATP